MNVDNFISARPSVRVHAQPGGNSSLASVLYGGGSGAKQQERSASSNASAKTAQSPSSGGLANHDGEVHRTTTFEVSPEARTELLSMLKRMRLKTKKERSCKHILLFEDANSPNTLILQEAYDNYNALCLHERQDHAVDLEESLKNMGGEVKISVNQLKLLG